MPTAKRERQKQGRAARLAALEEARKKKQRRSQVLRFGLLGLLLVAVIVALVLRGGDGKDKNPATTPTTVDPNGTTTVPEGPGPPTATPVPAGASISGDTPCPAFDGSSPRTTTFAKAPPMCIDAKKKYQAVFDTTEGTITVDLDVTKTPNTANNFVVLALYHYYDGSAIPRIDTDIDIIQGGSPNTQTISDPGPGYTINDEGSGFTYKAGDLVMARTGQPNSSGAQFFFGTGDKVSQLDSQGTYLNFGHTNDLTVLQKIAGLFTPCSSSDSACLGGGPSRVVTVNKITIVQS